MLVLGQWQPARHVKMKPGFFASLFAVSLSLMASACTVFGGKAAEEPAYRVILKDGAIEIREYEAYAVAETVANEPFEAATGTGFRRLFDYISSANQGSSEIAMTAPVFVGPEKIEMTAPVFVTPEVTEGASGQLDGGARDWRIAFVLPEGVTAAAAPVPNDARVTLRDVPARRVAAIRFSGLFRDREAESQRLELTAWLEARGLGHAEDWQMAGYNPPWTLPFLRRNEVIVTLHKEE